MKVDLTEEELKLILILCQRVMQKWSVTDPIITKSLTLHAKLTPIYVLAASEEKVVKG